MATRRPAIPGGRWRPPWQRRIATPGGRDHHQPDQRNHEQPRMSIMRLLLSSGAEGKRIHSQADLGAASLADPFPVEHRGEPERGRPAHEARTIEDDIVACLRWTRSDATIHACTALPTLSVAQARRSP